MDTHNDNDNAPHNGGVVVLLDPERPGQGWIELVVPLDDLLIYPGEDENEPTTVGIQFDFVSGSVCQLVSVILHAHDKLLELLGAEHA